MTSIKEKILGEVIGDVKKMNGKGEEDQSGAKKSKVDIEKR